MKCMYKIIPVLAVVLPMLYCIQGCTSSEKTTAPDGLVEGSVGIAADLSMKADPDDIGPLRFRMQAWTTGSEPELAFDFTWYSSTGSVNEPVRMIPGTYDILFWADRQPEEQSEELYYDTESLKSVKIINSLYTHGDGREAFCGVLESQEFISGTDLTVTLSRPLAKLMIKVPDGKEISEVSYDSLLSTFDVYEGSASSEEPVSCNNLRGSEFTDYVFPGAMTVTIKYGSNETRTVGLNAETLKANYITNITISE